jgi:hypothetical protein
LLAVGQLALDLRQAIGAKLLPIGELRLSRLRPLRAHRLMPGNPVLDLLHALGPQLLAVGHPRLDPLDALSTDLLPVHHLRARHALRPVFNRGEPLRPRGRREPRSPLGAHRGEAAAAALLNHLGALSATAALLNYLRALSATAAALLKHLGAPFVVLVAAMTARSCRCRDRDR